MSDHHGGSSRLELHQAGVRARPISIFRELIEAMCKPQRLRSRSLQLRGFSHANRSMGLVGSPYPGAALAKHPTCRNVDPLSPTTSSTLQQRSLISHLGWCIKLMLHTALGCRWLSRTHPLRDPIREIPGWPLCHCSSSCLPCFGSQSWLTGWGRRQTRLRTPSACTGSDPTLTMDGAVIPRLTFRCIATPWAK
jgi:hypothetical protein